MNSITPDDFTCLSGYIEGISGIRLDWSKAYLVEARLGRVITELRYGSYLELYDRARADGTGGIRDRIIDAITTGETLFFRDSSPYELLTEKIVPDFISSRVRQNRLPATLRIWSAACSTGQEIYSIAMLLKDRLPSNGAITASLLATDISGAAIARASLGRYNRMEIERGLPEDKLLRYFHREPDVWRISDEIRAMVSCKRLNLLEDFTRLGKFDIIFCRNVAYYFAEATRTCLFQRLENALEPGGCLVLGATETLAGQPTRLVSMQHRRSYYYQLQPTTESRPRQLPTLSAAKSVNR